MSIVDLLKETYISEVEDEFTSDEEITTEEPIADTGEGNPKEIVDVLVKNGKGKIKSIKNMLKYAANSNEEYDIFDSALDYFESIEDSLGADDAPSEPVEEPVEEPVVDEPIDEPTEEPTADLESGDDEEIPLDF